MSILIAAMDGDIGFGIANRRGAPFPRENINLASGPELVLVLFKKTAGNTYEPYKAFSGDEICEALIKAGELNPENLGR